MVRPAASLLDDEEPVSNLTRAFRNDIVKWKFKKNDNGEWIVPIWEDETFVEHILTPSESWKKIDWFNNELNTCIEFTEIRRNKRTR